MSLKIWLPLNGNLNNQGLENISITNNGATISEKGKIGKQCFYFNSKTMILPSYSSTRSICFWLKAPLTNSTIAMVDYKSSMAFGFGSAGGILVKCGSGNLAVYNNTNFTPNQWIHVTLTRNDALSDIKLYFNGIQQTARGTASVWTNTVDGCYLGGRSTGTYMQCYINDFRVYDHELSQKEITEIAKGLMIHYKLEDPNPDIFTSTPKSTTPANYQAKQLNLSTNLATSTTYTIQFWDVNVSHTGKTESTIGLDVYWGGGSVRLCYWHGTSYFSALTDGSYHADYLVKTFTTPASGSGITNAWFNLYNSVPSASGTMNLTVGKWKIEAGNVATQYTNNINSNQITDCSGFSYSATTNIITASSDTARYKHSSIFNGSSSYIKVNDNIWMADAMPAFTINVWAKTSSWPTTGHLFSCTESGGFNCEAGNSGYWRFPIHVYTSSAQSTSAMAYKYDSNELKLSSLPTNEWVMITWIYDSTGTRTYINGALHHTYTNTSYGVHFNTNARLFLGCEANTASPTGAYWGGQLSDFRFYSTALSAAAIKELYETSGTIDNNGNVYAREVIE